MSFSVFSRYQKYDKKEKNIGEKDFDCEFYLSQIESTKTTSMEDISTGVLEKMKSI